MTGTSTPLFQWSSWISDWQHGHYHEFFIVCSADGRDWCLTVAIIRFYFWTLTRTEDGFSGIFGRFRLLLRRYFWNPPAISCGETNFNRKQISPEERGAAVASVNTYRQKLRFLYVFFLFTQDNILSELHTKSMFRLEHWKFSISFFATS